MPEIKKKRADTFSSPGPSLGAAPADSFDSFPHSYFIEIMAKSHGRYIELTLPVLHLSAPKRENRQRTSGKDGAKSVEGGR